MIDIIQRPVTLENSWPGYYDRVAIVDHIQDGFMEGSFARFNNPSEEVSAHFGISLAGRIEQWVSMDRSAWANGILEIGWDDTIPWLVECQRKKIRINERTISIEHEGKPGNEMPIKQYQASLELHKYIIKTWPNIWPNRQHIIGHYQISPQSRERCPGPLFPWERLISDLVGDFMKNSIPVVPGNYKVNPKGTAFWYQHGGLPIFGYPTTGEVSANGNFGPALNVQYFERARFEYQPDGSVVLGLVGNEANRMRGAGPIR